MNYTSTPFPDVHMVFPLLGSHKIAYKRHKESQQLVIVSTVDVTLPAGSYVLMGRYMHCWSRMNEARYSDWFVIANTTKQQPSSSWTFTIQTLPDPDIATIRRGLKLILSHGPSIQSQTEGISDLSFVYHQSPTWSQRKEEKKSPEQPSSLALFAKQRRQTRLANMVASAIQSAIEGHKQLQLDSNIVSTQRMSGQSQVGDSVMLLSSNN